MSREGSLCRVGSALTAAWALSLAVPVLAAELDETPFVIRPLTLSAMQPPINPADEQRSAQQDAQARAAAQAQDQNISLQNAPRPRLRSFELPAVTVVGEKSDLREEDRVGPYAQPRWTATRRFPSTRVYVVPEGKVEVEYWLRPTFEQDGNTEIRSLYEIEFGLPYRFQLDLYLRTDQDGDGSEMLLGEQVEIRWALADWGQIWGNPTLYIEWVGLEERPDKVEAKLLLGGEITRGWH